MTGPSGSAQESEGALRPAASAVRKPDRRLGRARRLTRSSSFQEAYNQGRRRVGRYLVLWVRSGEGASLRLGVVASRKVGPSVARSRARRLLREAFRRNRHRLRGEVDVVLVARASILAAGWNEIVEDLMDAAAKAGIMHKEAG